MLPPLLQVHNLDIPGADMYRKLRLLRSEKGMLSQSDEKQLKMVKRQLEMEVLSHADVVCSTCVGAGDPRLALYRFQHVLIDEATQAMEPEGLIPMTRGAKQVRRGLFVGWSAPHLKLIT